MAGGGGGGGGGGPVTPRTPPRSSHVALQPTRVYVVRMHVIIKATSQDKAVPIIGWRSSGWYLGL